MPQGLDKTGETMQINVSSSHNIDGTLILPLFEGTDIVPEAHATGMRCTQHKSTVSSLMAISRASQVHHVPCWQRVEGLLVGLGKEDDADVHAYRKLVLLSSLLEDAGPISPSASLVLASNA